MTKASVTTKWIEAGKKLAHDKNASVLCPVQEDGSLVVVDIPIFGTKKFERVMECSKCGAKNILLMETR